MWVNLEFLNGIKGCLEVCVEDGFELLLWNLESALRTSPRAESEALMAEAGKWKGQGVRTKGRDREDDKIEGSYLLRVHLRRPRTFEHARSPLNRQYSAFPS